ncbi:hypothetical protein EYF80_047608 [Liparis tanakae]|uniref:Uncharacterized protein n=1 Tax=Liparis tanakae TaxID=230148 RepID=A0A4Z2FN87_9TELE|nr:hypothetical protein EYF80_047608 [Liparis tanakae]
MERVLAAISRGCSQQQVGPAHASTQDAFLQQGAEALRLDAGRMTMSCVEGQFLLHIPSAVRCGGVEEADVEEVGLRRAS